MYLKDLRRVIFIMTYPQQLDSMRVVQTKIKECEADKDK